MEAYGKIKLNGEIEVVTGLHIGDNDNNSSMIGAIDSPVVRDSLYKNPIIPGSSLKGKMRYLLTRNLENSLVELGKEKDEITRLFGRSNTGENIPKKESRLKFSDCFICNKTELEEMDLNITESKSENSINRITGVANPRQIERVIRGAKFKFDLIYDVEEMEEIEEDFKNIKDALFLLENDYLGGHGSRGSGRIKFNNLEAKRIIGKIDQKVIDKINNIIANGVKYDEL
jgi:CRISPR-associated protein Csm3